MHRLCDRGKGCVTNQTMRDWMGEKLMRRRSKRGPNESESTGKSGQELPTNQMAPLRPDYPEQAARVEPVPQPDVTAEMHGLKPGEGVSAPQIVVEHQPESVGQP